MRVGGKQHGVGEWGSVPLKRHTHTRALISQVEGNLVTEEGAGTSGGQGYPSMPARGQPIQGRMNGGKVSPRPGGFSYLIST